MACATAVHEQKVAAFMAEFEDNVALKNAGVCIKRGEALIMSPDGQQVMAKVNYIQFDVGGAQGEPTTESPAAQDMA